MRTLILIFTLALMGCSSDDDVQGGTLDFSLVGKGVFHGNGVENIQESNLVLQDVTAWNGLMDQMDRVNNESDGFEQTDIDFSKFLVLAVFDQIRTTGGHSIAISGIIDQGDKIVVKVERSKPGQGDDTQVITQPYHLVKMAITARPIVFE